MKTQQCLRCVVPSPFSQRERLRTSIYKKEQIIFSNPVQADIQRLCIGTNGKCEQGVGDKVPDELIAPGLLIQPGQTIPVTFSCLGDYSITSTTTPYMNMTVHIFIPGDVDTCSP